MLRREVIKAFAALTAGIVFPIPAKIKYRLRILPWRCVGCRDCYRVCPGGEAIQMRRGKAVINPDECTSCMKCESVCSYGAIARCEKLDQ